MINVSSAAQESVNLDALAGNIHLKEAFSAYAQSKLAITMWSRMMDHKYKDSGPMFIAVNPGSLLASKMVKEGFGVAGKDLGIGADILISCSIDDEFANAGGLYFDNDLGDFASPHQDALDDSLCKPVVDKILSIF